MNNHISHDGVVTKIEGRQVTVQFVQKSACADCHAKMLCSSGDAKQRFIVADNFGLEYKIGEQVEVEITTQLAWTAMLYAFGLPTLLALCCLFPFISLMGELWASLALLGVLGLYYVVLYQFRKRLERKVVFLLHRKY